MGGCESSKDSLDRHLKRGDELVGQQKLAEAIVEYGAAVQADDHSAIARQKLADAHIQNNEPAKALPHYIRAADLLPNDAAAQVTAGQMLLLAEKFDDARGRAEKVLATQPNNMAALVLKGNALAGLKDIEGALKQVEDAVRADPSQMMGYANLGMLEYAKGELSRAEGTFKTAIAKDPNSTIPRLALANLYWSTRRTDDAVKTLKDALAIEPANRLMNRALAMVYMSAGRMAEAEAPLKTLVEKDPESVERFTLADYYVRANRTPEAKALLEEMAKSSKAEISTGAKLRLAALGLSMGDRTTTMQLIEQILAGNPRQPEALLARAQVLRAEGKRDAALADARLAIQSKEAFAQAHYLTGQLLADGQQYDDAIAEQKEAIRVNSTFAKSYVELARLSFLVENDADAINYAKQAIRLMPGFPDSYVYLARAQVRSGHPEAAEQPIRVLVDSFPDNPKVRNELGQLQLAKGDVSGARASFERALAKDAADITALHGLNLIDIRQQNGAAVRKRMEKAVADHPDNQALHVVAGRAYLLLAESGAAEKMLKRAVSLNSNDLDAYGLLASVYIQQNRLPEATAEFQKLAVLQPKSVSTQTMLGMLLHMQNKVDEAKTQYERVLTLDRQAAAASNNLAQIYVDRNENLDLALTLAQTAKSGLPKSFEVDDTIGWIYYKKGLGPQAVSSLKAAVAAQPDNAICLYHLGAAYALNKENSNARLTLQKALTKGVFEGADDARRILDSLK